MDRPDLTWQVSVGGIISFFAQTFRTGRDELLQQLGCELLKLGACELSGFGIGGADGIRTHYLLTASQTLSRLSYSPTWFKNITKQLGKLKLKQLLKSRKTFRGPR